MTKKQIRVIKNEIMNAKTQEQIAEVVDKFDDFCNMDMFDDVYSKSDMEDNIDDLDNFHEPSEITSPNKYTQMQLDLWNQDAKILDRLADDDYPDGDDLFFHEDGTPVSIKDLQDIAISMLKGVIGEEVLD